MKRLRTTIAIGAALVTAAPASSAVAQEGGDPGITDIEVPTLVLDDGAVEVGDDGDDLDLANIVQSAARAVTTVQEAPAIVTVITAEEIRERHARNLSDLIDPVPGYMRTGAVFNQFPQLATRGQQQSTQILHDQLSMFDPYVNVSTIHDVVPLELIKRVELITGPGGVLWGSNSLLGIVNVITKDAEDVDGVEVGVTGGHGPGNREYLHGYVMAGDEEVLGKDDVKLLVHGSFKTYHGAAYEMPGRLFSATIPQPNSPVLYAPLSTGDPPRSFLFSAFAKLTWGKTQLRVFLPYVERQHPLGFGGVVVRQDLPEDDLPACQMDLDQPIVPGDGCSDKLKQSRQNRSDFYDRYAVLEYRTRMAGGKAGISAKAYAQQFLRTFAHLQVLAPIEGVLEGGLAFRANPVSYRAGSAIDGDVELPGNARLLYGVEGFHEWVTDDVTRARQGDGIETFFFAPYDLSRLPLPCPRERVFDPDTGAVSSGIMEGCPLTFMFSSSRTVFGAYVAPQWRPVKKLILDAGARVQVAPEGLGVNDYDPTINFATSAVYNFLPNWHVKANFAQGFRPPVFNNLNSNGTAIQIDGEQDLDVETTDAVQAEVNARLFKGERRIRELNFRLDYSYTHVQNLIQVQGGRYQNTGERGINSVEFLGKLYIQGGHRLELGYTWLTVDTADRGRFRTAPEHWFNLLGVFNVVDDRVWMSSNLRVLGAMEDSNRMVEHRNIRFCSEADAADLGCRVGDIFNPNDPNARFVTNMPAELVLDRIPPTAELMFGLTWMASPRLTVNAEVFNAFNGRFYQADLFFDYEPRIEFQPNPYEDLRAFVGATYTY